jgi:hypothetical protein
MKNPNNMLKVSVEDAAKFFGVSVERIKAQYLENAKGLEEMYVKAVTTGKKVNGYTADQLYELKKEYYKRAS